MKHLLRKTLAGILASTMIFTGISITAPKTARAEEGVTAAVEEETAAVVAVEEETGIESESLDNAGDSVVPNFFEMTNGGWRDLYMGEGKEVGMQFTAPEDGRYAFFTSGDLDTYADMAWNKNMSPIVATNDDISGLNRNFRIDTYMSKGSTVYVKMRGYDGAVGSFRAHVCQINEVDFDWNGGEMGPDHMEKLLKYLAYLPDEFPVWGYHIFFDANGGTLPRSDEYKYFEKEFLGWNTSVDGSGTMYQPGGGFSNDSVSTLYAIWRNRPAGLLPVPTRAGYAFQGWYLSDGVQLTETTVLDGETGVSARWTPDPNSNPLTNGAANREYLQKNGELYFCFTAPSTGYYVFGSESDIDVIGYLYSDSAMKTQLQYDDDSGNNRNFRIRQLLSGGQKVYLKVTGYQEAFGNVSVIVKQELTATYTSGTTVQTETIYYGANEKISSWVPTRNYTVTFDANGGTPATSTKTLSVTFKSWTDQDGLWYGLNEDYVPMKNMSFTATWTNPKAGTLPTPTRSGYTFDGWYTAASGGTKITADSIIYGSVTLYAHWTKNAVAVTFPFTDVKRTDWYYFTVKEAYETGVMTGKTSTTFAPNEKMNRAMVVTVLHRLAGYPKVAYTKLFTDVPSGQYYSSPVMWAANNKIVNGYADNTFRPMANVTREQLATMLMNFAKAQGMSVSARADLSAFVDKNMISSYAQTGLSWAVASGIMSGTGDGKLQPKKEATRAEAAKMLLQFYRLMEK